MKAIKMIIIGNENEENVETLILIKDRTRETRRNNYTRDRYGNHGHNLGKMESRADNRSRRRVMRAALADRCAHQEKGCILTKV